jgi:hypothetical protein
MGVLVFLSARGMRRLAGMANLGPATLPRSVKKSVQESRHYGRLIGRSLQQCPPGPLRDRLSLMIRPVDEWLAKLVKLERSLAKSYSQRNLVREMRQTTFEVERLRREVLQADEDEALYLRDLLNSKKNHLAALQELNTFQNRAELKIRKIASDLGATHAEMMLIIARGDFNEIRLNRLDENLREHVSSMRDIMTAMDELGYSSGAVNS